MTKLAELATKISESIGRLDQPVAYKGLDLGHPNAFPWLWEPSRDLQRARRAVGDGSTNSAVHNVLQVKSTAFCEPQPVVVDKDKQPLPDHPVSVLLRQPNPLMVWDFVGDYKTWSEDVGGEAYLWKRRSAAGLVVELWPLIPQYVTPKGSNAELIEYFEYTPAGQPIRIEANDIVYLRTGLNRRDHRRGNAPIRNVLLEVMTDEEASRYAAYLLTNMGVPGVMILPRGDDGGPTPQEAEEIAEEFQERFSGANRGKAFVPYGGPVDVKVLSFSPEQMDVKALRRVPEERIAGAVGVPMSLAQLGAGMQTGNSLGDGSAREVERRFFTRQKLIPLWKLAGRLLTNQLMINEGEQPGLTIEFPLSEVAALQDDKDSASDRLATGVQIGAATVGDWRKSQGLPVDDSHDLFLRPVGALEVPAQT